MHWATAIFPLNSPRCVETPTTVRGKCSGMNDSRRYLLHASAAELTWFKLIFGLGFITFSFACLVKFYRSRDIFEIRARCGRGRCEYFSGRVGTALSLVIGARRQSPVRATHRSVPDFSCFLRLFGPFVRLFGRRCRLWLFSLRPMLHVARYFQFAIARACTCWKCCQATVESTLLATTAAPRHCSSW